MRGLVLLFMIMVLTTGAITMESANSVLSGSSDGVIEGMALEYIGNFMSSVAEAFFDVIEGDGIHGFRNIFISIDEMIPYTDATPFRDMFDKGFKDFM